MRVGLTSRQSQVLALVADGHTDKEIARALGLTRGTVSGYVSEIVLRMNARNRTHAVAMWAGGQVKVNREAA